MRGKELAEDADILEIIRNNKDSIPGCVDAPLSATKIIFFEPSFYTAIIKSNKLPEKLSFGDRYDLITNLILIDKCANKIYPVDEIYEKRIRIFPKNRFGYIQVQQTWEDTVEIHYVVNPKIGIRQKIREWILGDGQGYRIKFIKLER